VDSSPKREPGIGHFTADSDKYVELVVYKKEGDAQKEQSSPA